MKAMTAVSIVCRAIARHENKKDWKEHDSSYGDGNCEFAVEYGEKGYDKPKAGILFANWNHVPKHICAALERRGFELEWSDEWLICYENDMKAYRTSPSGHGWKPYYVIDDTGDTFGGDEIEEDESRQEWYVNEYLLNNSKRCNTFSIDFAKHGFEQFNGKFENGFHQGMNDEPSDIAKRIRAEFPNHDYLFSLDDTSQFYITFSAWIRPKGKEDNED